MKRTSALLNAAFHELFLVGDVMGFLCNVRGTCVHIGFKSVGSAGDIGNVLCGQAEEDVAMDYPFMIQMPGTACQVPDTKQGKPRVC